MVKFLSVAWLAQSHRHTTDEEEPAYGHGHGGSSRPHVPCMVQPRAPAFGRGYLQPKPRANKPTEEPTPEPHLCASPVSETSGYSSGYESEAASSECPSVDSEAERDSPQRRVRTKFTPEQINKLEKIFNKHKYLDAGERVKTARKLSLTETQVRTWFQNRRMKLKREVQDLLAPQVPAPLLFQGLAQVQYPGVGGQRTPYPATGAAAFYPLPVPQMVLQHPGAPHPHIHAPPPPPHIMMHNNPHYY